MKKLTTEVKTLTVLEKKIPQNKKSEKEIIHSIIRNNLDKSGTLYLDPIPHLNSTLSHVNSLSFSEMPGNIQGYSFSFSDEKGIVSRQKNSRVHRRI